MKDSVNLLIIDTIIYAVMFFIILILSLSTLEYLN